MELKAGYKKSEAGVIPDDWSSEKIASICVPSKTRILPSNSPNHRCVELEHLASETGRLLGYANSRELKSQKTVFKPHDTLFGKLRPYLRKYFYADFEGVCTTEIWALRPSNEIDPRFLYYLVQSDRFVNAANQSTGTKMPRAEWKTMSDLDVCLPPSKKEQTAIATALSDADALIASLEKLIAKKRLIKQGVMQKLLEPKEGWKAVPLTEVCWFQEGPGLRNWQFTKNGMKVINVTNLEDGFLNLERTDRHISIDEFKRMYTHFEIQEQDIVVASSGNSYGKVAVVRKQDLPLLMNTSVIRFKPLPNKIDYNFLLVFLKSTAFKGQIDLLITGGAQPNFGPAHLKKVNINIPRTIEEQSTISTRLIDIENEIAALQSKVSKATEIKRGMMQTLLTGKIRLI